MDFAKDIKKLLEESNEIEEILTSLRLDKEAVISAAQDANLCCASSSFIFLYLESFTSFLAISLNRLCKSFENSLSKACQVKICPLKHLKDKKIVYFHLNLHQKRININVAPVGKVKKCLINSTGKYILLVYDKSLSVVDLPPKWGKYDQYSGGNLNTICK